jgi:predicted negative regulator of RcsB-dependent stress response
VDRLSRKDLKTDKFAVEVGHTMEYVAEHKSQVKLYGLIALGVLVVGGAYYWYSSHQNAVRQQDLAAAIQVEDGTVGTPQPPLPNFPTQEEKDKARTKAFADVVAKHPGSQEAAIAMMYLASYQSDKANYSEAEKVYKQIIDSAPKDYVAVAKVALANVYSAQGKTIDAEKVLREVVSNPTVFVSKEEATIHLAEVMAQTNPGEARKILEPLRGARSTVSKAAVRVLGGLPPSDAK